MFEQVSLQPRWGDGQPASDKPQNVTVSASTTPERFEELVAVKFRLGSWPVQLQIKIEEEDDEDDIFSDIAASDVLSAMRDPLDTSLPRNDRNRVQLYVQLPQHMQPGQQQQQQQQQGAQQQGAHDAAGCSAAASSGAASTAAAAVAKKGSGSAGKRKHQGWMSAAILAINSFGVRNKQGVFALRGVPLTVPTALGKLEQITPYA
jgi:hypothetical protein